MDEKKKLIFLFGLEIHINDNFVGDFFICLSGFCVVFVIKLIFLIKKTSLPNKGIYTILLSNIFYFCLFIIIFIHIESKKSNFADKKERKEKNRKRKRKKQKKKNGKKRS